MGTKNGNIIENSCIWFEHENEEVFKSTKVCISKALFYKL